MPFSFDFFAALRRMREGARDSNAPAGPQPAPPAPPAPAAQPPATADLAAPRSVGAEGIALIKRFEGCARRRADGLIEAYPDPATGAAPWTIGWGATGRGIARGTVWTQAQCDERLTRDLARYAGDVVRAIGAAPTTQAQFDALVSFHYNTGAIARATLTRLHRAGDHAAAAREFARWTFAAGRRLPGLVRRREAEAQLYRTVTKSSVCRG